MSVSGADIATSTRNGPAEVPANGPSHDSQDNLQLLGRGVKKMVRIVQEPRHLGLAGIPGLATQKGQGPQRIRHCLSGPPLLSAKGSRYLGHQEPHGQASSEGQRIGHYPKW